MSSSRGQPVAVPAGHPRASRINVLKICGFRSLPVELTGKKGRAEGRFFGSSPRVPRTSMEPCRREYWSGKRDSNSRPRPWQGRALPTELFPHLEQRANCKSAGSEVKATRPWRRNKIQPAPILRASAAPCYRRSSGQAARRYATMETSVAAAAITVSTTPIL
jgi:hypothetical protein